MDTGSHVVLSRALNRNGRDGGAKPKLPRRQRVIRCNSRRMDLFRRITNHHSNQEFQIHFRPMNGDSQTLGNTGNRCRLVNDASCSPRQSMAIQSTTVINTTVMLSSV